MSEIHEQSLEALRDELKKTAALPAAISRILASRALPKMLGSAGAMGGIGAGVGAGAGGLIQGIRKYRQAKEQGATGGQAAISGLMGGLQGVGKGALIGAGAGALGGGALGYLDPAKAEAFRKGVTRSSRLARFGQRQVHGLTGYTPSSGIRSLGIGSGPLSEAEKMGLTSLPGYAKALKREGVKKTLTEAAKHSVKGSGKSGLLLAGAFPAMGVAGAMMTPKEQLEAQGSSRAKEIGKSLGGAALGTLASPIAGLVAMPSFDIGSRLGGSVGGAIGKLTPQRKKQLQSQVDLPYLQGRELTNESGQQVPGERVVSDRAQGLPPEGYG